MFSWVSYFIECQNKNKKIKKNEAISTYLHIVQFLSHLLAMIPTLLEGKFWL